MAYEPERKEDDCNICALEKTQLISPKGFEDLKCIHFVCDSCWKQTARVKPLCPFCREIVLTWMQYCGYEIATTLGYDLFDPLLMPSLGDLSSAPARNSFAPNVAQMSTIGIDLPSSELPFSYTTSFDADFDGDEVNIRVPQIISVPPIAPSRTNSSPRGISFAENIGFRTLISTPPLVIGDALHDDGSPQSFALTLRHNTPPLIPESMVSVFGIPSPEDLLRSSRIIVSPFESPHQVPHYFRITGRSSDRYAGHIETPEGLPSGIMAITGGDPVDRSRSANMVNRFLSALEGLLQLSSTSNVIDAIYADTDNIMTTFDGRDVNDGQEEQTGEILRGLRSSSSNSDIRRYFLILLSVLLRSQEDPIMLILTEI